MRKEANVSLETVGYCLASLPLSKDQVAMFRDMILHHGELPMQTGKQFDMGIKLGANQVAWGWM